MKKRSWLFIFIIILVGFLLVKDRAGKAQNEDKPDKPLLNFEQTTLSEKNLAERNTISDFARRRGLLIDEELANSLNDEWAGEYYCGDRLGYNISLKIAPKNGFIFTHTGCMGLYGFNHGDVTVAGNLLRLNFTEPEGEIDNRDVTSELNTVRWGERHYLIATERMIDFCNAINNGFEPGLYLGSLFLHKKEDEKKKVTGEPLIPVQFREYLLKKPLRAEITEVLNHTVFSEDIMKRNVTEVIVNIGTADGLKKGMELRVVKPDISSEIEITEVYEHSARGILVQLQFDDDIKIPTRGWQAITGHRKL